MMNKQYDDEQLDNLENDDDHYEIDETYQIDWDELWAT